MLYNEKEFDAITFGEILLRLSAPINERISTSAVFEKELAVLNLT